MKLPCIQRSVFVLGCAVVTVATLLMQIYKSSSVVDIHMRQRSQVSPLVQTVRQLTAEVTRTPMKVTSSTKVTSTPIARVTLHIETGRSASTAPQQGAEATVTDDFARSVKQVKRHQRSHHLYAFNSISRLPLLRLNSPAEADAAHRVREASTWLSSSVDVVFAATVRNAMRGLPSTADQVTRLAKLFRNASFVFMENDSSDDTRKFLVDWRRRDPRLRLLGCGGSKAPCRLNVSYSTGVLHRQGWSQKRSDTERLERGVLMSALRNIYLTHIYQHLAQTHTLLIVVDADLSFRPWNLDAILQGLYYFRDRPKLQSLCAHTRFRKYVYDACTLHFYPNYHFSQSPESRIAVNFPNVAITGPPPVKVDSCFQAFTAYRLSHLAQKQLLYGPAEGETVCEHNTLARQLRENYLDFNMRLDTAKQNEGGL